MELQDKIWLSGVLDCDGMIGPRRRSDGKFYPRLFFGNTDLSIVKKVSLIFGSPVYKSKDRAGRKTYYTTTASRNDVVLEILSNILPYLVAKKDRAKELISQIKEKKWRSQSGKTPDEVEKEIIFFYKNGQTYKWLGNKFLISTATVFNVLKRNGVIFSPRTA